MRFSGAMASDTSFGVQMPQKILQKIPLVVDDYAIDDPFSTEAGNSSLDIAQVTKNSDS